MIQNEITTVRTEIAAIRTATPDADILVSVNANGECIWGEASALEAGEMEQAMNEIGFSINGMLTAEEFEARF